MSRIDEYIDETTTEKFNRLGSVYAAGRPIYAEQFLAELYEKFGFSPNCVIEEYINQLEQLFYEYAGDNTIIMPNKTIVYAGYAA